MTTVLVSHKIRFEVSSFSRSERTHKIGQDIHSVCKVETEDNSLCFIRCAATLSAVKLLVEIVTCKDAAEYAANPRLSDVSNAEMTTMV